MSKFTHSLSWLSTVAIKLHAMHFVHVRRVAALHVLPPDLHLVHTLMYHVDANWIHHPSPISNVSVRVTTKNRVRFQLNSNPTPTYARTDTPHLTATPPPPSAICPPSHHHPFSIPLHPSHPLPPLPSMPTQPHPTPQQRFPLSLLYCASA